MRVILVALLASAFAVGCGSDVSAPTPSPSLRSTQASVSPPPTFVPLPANIAGIPEVGNPNTALVPPDSRRGELEVGVARNFPLGHCGLATPIDIDGSLWDPMSGHGANGGPLTEDHIGELINATPTAIVLLDQSTMQMTTLLGAVITLTRHDGPRRYFLCD